MSGGPSSDVDETLRAWLAENPSISSYVVVNSDGIPVKYHQSLSYTRAVEFAALVTDFSRKAKKCLSNFALAEDDFCVSRLRTNVDSEILILAVGEYVLVVVQDEKNSKMNQNASKASNAAHNNREPGSPPSGGISGENSKFISEGS